MSVKHQNLIFTDTYFAALEWIYEASTWKQTGPLQTLNCACSLYSNNLNSVTYINMCYNMVNMERKTNLLLNLDSQLIFQLASATVFVILRNLLSPWFWLTLNLIWYTITSHLLYLLQTAHLSKLWIFHLMAQMCVCSAEQDGCEPNPCLNGGVCRGYRRNHLCVCKEGYVGDRCQTCMLTIVK